MIYDFFILANYLVKIPAVFSTPAISLPARSALYRALHTEAMKLFVASYENYGFDFFDLRGMLVIEKSEDEALQFAMKQQPGTWRNCWTVTEIYVSKEITQ